MADRAQSNFPLSCVGPTGGIKTGRAGGLVSFVMHHEIVRRNCLNQTGEGQEQQTEARMHIHGASPASGSKGRSEVIGPNDSLEVAIEGHVAFA